MKKIRAQSRKWSEEELALLGTMPDGEVARRTGRSFDSVSNKRRELNVKARPREDRWTEEDEALLGTMPDEKLAAG